VPAVGVKMPRYRTAANGDAGNLARGKIPEILEKSLPDTLMVQPDSDMSSGNIPAISRQEMTPSNGAESSRVATLDAEATISELSSKTPADAGNDAPAIIVDKETRPKKRAKSKIGMNPVNPLFRPSRMQTKSSKYHGCWAQRHGLWC